MVHPLFLYKFYVRLLHLFHPAKIVPKHHYQSLCRWRGRRGTHHHVFLPSVARVASPVLCFHLCKGFFCLQYLHCHWHAFSGFEIVSLKGKLTKLINKLLNLLWTGTLNLSCLLFLRFMRIKTWMLKIPVKHLLKGDYTAFTESTGPGGGRGGKVTLLFSTYVPWPTPPASMTSHSNGQESRVACTN